MKPVAIDDFLKLKYLSQPTFSPEGSCAAFVVSEADRKKNGYRSYIYVLKDGKTKKLTSFGQEKSFQFLDEDTILFPGKREKDDEEAPGSVWYRISLNGGEAEEMFRFPIPVARLRMLPDGNAILTGKTLPGFEDLYKGDPKYLKNYLKYKKDNADYEEIAQVPWWWNGGTYTKGAYDSLFFYDARKKALSRISALNEAVSSLTLSEDGTKAYFVRSEIRPLLPRYDESVLCELEIRSGKIKELFRSSQTLALKDYYLLKSFVLLYAADQTKNGRNTNGDFYRLDKDGRPQLLAVHGEPIGSSVGADIRLGGGSSTAVEGDTFYFISTRFDGACLFKLENGTITQLTERPGSADCLSVKNGRILTVALYDMKGQELYDGKGRQLTHFNDAVLRNRYVAQPEALNVKRGGYEVHGFVLKPMDYDPAKKYPVILDIHGGPKTVYGPVFYHEMQYWAGKGYFVIFCNPTGSDGRGAFLDIRGKYGTVDFEDIMAFCDEALKVWPAMDESNFFETGGSYGGFMTNWIVGHTDRFKACASQRSISNWTSFYGVSDIGVGFGTDQNGADAWTDLEKVWEQSPLKYADRAKTPTLFIHSFEDYRCPIDQGYQMFTALIAHGVESKMVCFRGENHELSRSGKPSHRLKRLSEITEWFEKHKG